MEAYDEELAALVRKNVAMLSEIKEDLSVLQEADGDGASRRGQVLTLGDDE